MDRDEIALEWQRQRSRFNHDWLKNQYTQALGKWINILDGEVDDPITERNFIARVLPEWTARRPELADLLNRFECAMSPRRFFEFPPLSFCDQCTGEWLPEVMHTLWKHKYGCDELVREATVAAVAVDEMYTEIAAELSKTAGASADAVRPLVGAFIRLRFLCETLGSVLSKFPAEIRPV